MNPIIASITGRAGSVQEDVPVPCGILPARSYRDRLARLRQRRGEDVSGQALKDEDGSVKDALGESEQSSDVIPDDADDLDPMEQEGGTITARLKPIKDVVMEPTKPKDDDEKFTSPFSALTAPDATPDSLTQIDPSKLPGAATEKFATKDATEAAPASPAAPAELSASDTGTDNAMRTMDVLLGRKRTGSPSSERKPEEFQKIGAITTEAQALAALNISTVTGDALLAQGRDMPPPAPSDGKTIYETARRFGPT